MLIRILDELKANNTKDNFERIMKATEDDIKFNRVRFNKRTSVNEFIAILKLSEKVVLRC